MIIRDNFNLTWSYIFVWFRYELDGSSNMLCLVVENRMKADKRRGKGDRSNFELIVPVMNIWRQKMWKQHQAAWPFNHVGLDATALLFSNEVLVCISDG